MATLIGDVFADSTRFHTMIGGSALQQQHSHETPSSYHRHRSISRPREYDAHSQNPQSTVSPRRQGSATSATARYPGENDGEWEAPAAATGATDKDIHVPRSSTNPGVSIFPSPPSSSSPSETSSGGVRPQHGTPAYIASAPKSSNPTSAAAQPLPTSSSMSATSTVSPGPSRVIPSPESDSDPTWHPASSNPPAQSGQPLADSLAPPATAQTTIRVRDLAHIQSLARADILSDNTRGTLDDPPLQQMKYEISGMPIADVIEMVAALLTKITTSNDEAKTERDRDLSHVKHTVVHAKSEDGIVEGSLNPLSSSVLAFHGKNVPAITILSYLTRIHKYCPTTYEVFLSLLVYFDRMAERINKPVMDRQSQLALVRAHGTSSGSSRPSVSTKSDADIVMHDDDSDGNSDETDSDLADDDDDDDDVDDDDAEDVPVEEEGPAKRSLQAVPAGPISPSLDARDPAAQPPGTYFVVDSYNIHRLIIAGVTCASKFFSDVFYTNSRYAKVGGLPLAELNHLELQFLILNDFRLAIPVEDLEAYATMLVEFYVREVVGQRLRPVLSSEF